MTPEQRGGPAGETHSGNGPDPSQAVAGPADVVTLSGIWRRFGTTPPVIALRGVDLRVRSGEWLAIVGPSGSGKSTLMNIIGCLDRPDEGSYLLNGLDVTTLTDDQRAGVRSRCIGFVFQAFHLLSHRTVAENVMLAEIYRGRPREGRRDRAMTALAAVGLRKRSEHLPTQLSGGERQRVAIARALVNEPSLLLCDEPTGNLDSRTSEAVLQMIETLHTGGLTVIMITHESEVAERAERQIRMIDGVIQHDLAGRAAR
ncbi:MAG TPA: ABC transporter ATP-binding protein [Pseudonocardia sp.]|jgi:ABC-type lipoprotein export system ATPase subunit|nr:ABC transporter ATP-binding protein [Pseudonocardia sp.]